eukprot:PhM_4_TR5203/c3_g1_i2/m.50854
MDVAVVEHVLQDIKVRQRLGRLPSRAHSCFRSNADEPLHHPPPASDTKKKPPLAPAPPNKPKSMKAQQQPITTETKYVRHHRTSSFSTSSSRRRATLLRDISLSSSSSSSRGGALTPEDLVQWSGIYYSDVTQPALTHLHHGGLVVVPADLLPEASEVPSNVDEFLEMVVRVKQRYVNRAVNANKVATKRVAVSEIEHQVGTIIPDFHFGREVAQQQQQQQQQQVVTVRIDDLDHLFEGTDPNGTEEDTIFAFLGGDVRDPGSAVPIDRVLGYLRSQIRPLVLNSVHPGLGLESIAYLENKLTQREAETPLTKRPQGLRRFELSQEVFPIIFEIVNTCNSDHRSEDSKLGGTAMLSSLSRPAHNNASLSSTQRGAGGSINKSKSTVQQLTANASQKASMTAQKLFTFTQKLRRTEKHKTDNAVSPAEGLKKELLRTWHRHVAKASRRIIKKGIVTDSGDATTTTTLNSPTPQQQQQQQQQVGGIFTTKARCVLVDYRLQHLDVCDVELLKWFVGQFDIVAPTKMFAIRVVRCLRRAIKILQSHEVDCDHCKQLRRLLSAVVSPPSHSANDVAGSPKKPHRKISSSTSPISTSSTTARPTSSTLLRSYQPISPLYSYSSTSSKKSAKQRHPVYIVQAPPRVQTPRNFSFSGSFSSSSNNNNNNNNNN